MIKNHNWIKTDELCTFNEQIYKIIDVSNLPYSVLILRKEKMEYKTLEVPPEEIEQICGVVKNNPCSKVDMVPHTFITQIEWHETRDNTGKPYLRIPVMGRITIEIPLGYASIKDFNQKAVEIKAILDNDKPDSNIPGDGGKEK